MTKVAFPKFRLKHFPNDLFVINQIKWPVFDAPTPEQKLLTDSESEKSGVIAAMIVDASLVGLEPVTKDGEFDLLIINTDEDTMRGFNTTLQISDTHRIETIVISGPAYDMALIQGELVTVH